MLISRNYSLMVASKLENIVRVCFVLCVDQTIEQTQMFGVRYMPVWVYTLAAHMRAAGPFDIKLHDTRLGVQALPPEADIYLYSALNQDVPANLDFLRRLRIARPTAKHAIGGPATGSLKQAGRLAELHEFDGIYIGEAEDEVVPFIQKVLSHTGPGPHVHQTLVRFALANAKPLDFTLLSQTFSQYYGGVIEVSRGCPFLCEFCDIRTLPDNNRAHNKPIETIIADLRQFHRLGISNVLFACDNFIGDPAWADRLCDAIIQLKRETGMRPRLYTWLTINIANHPAMMQKMRQAGFDMFFIGVESFGETQLLETAKIQNTKLKIPEAVRQIQSHGVVVVAGLIFGFDTDGDNVTEEALQGILDSGLISGDPTLLTALSGTPLYRRMQLAGRLREGKVALGGHKYSTNIRYLRPKDRIIAEYCRFVRVFNSSDFQLKRFRSFLRCLTPETSPVHEGGYIQPGKLLQLVKANRASLFSAAKRLGVFLASPMRVLTVARGAFLTARSPSRPWPHFLFWVFNWSNSLLKYGDLSAKDFDIESIQTELTRQHLLPDGYLEDYFEPIPHAKIKAQRQLTQRTLEKVLK